MNRPPFPPQYAPQYASPQGPGPQGTPGSIRSALITQSQRRYGFVRDVVNKLEAGFSELQYEASNVIAQAAQRSPQQRHQLEVSLAASLSAKDRVKRALDEVLAADVALQDELQRWLGGQPPSTYIPQAPAQYQQPQQTWQQPPQAQQGQQAPQAPQQNPAMMPNIPPGQLDMRDPRHAAAALLRAEQMPLSPTLQGAQPGSYGPMPLSPTLQGAQPGSYGPMQPPMQAPMPVPMPVAPPPAPNYFGQPLPQNPVPVQMPVSPPVMQYTSPEAAQAAVQASHAAGVPVAAVTAAPVAQNGAAGKPVSA